MNHCRKSRILSWWKTAWRLGLAALSLAVAFCLLVVQTAHAETIDVTTPNDIVDANGGNCAGLELSDLPGADGFTSLREALCAANTNPNSDTIMLPAGTYVLTKVGSGEDNNATGDLDILETGGDLVISGAGVSTTIIDGNRADRVIDFPPLFSKLIAARISGVTLRHGLVSSAGGGVYVDRPHNVVIENCTVFSNTALWGGGIYSLEADLDIVASTISENHATSRGGGVFHDTGGGTLRIEDSTLSGNRVTHTDDARGGGIYNAGGSLQISGSLLADNLAVTQGTYARGGAIYSGGGAVDISSSRLLNNSVTGGGFVGRGGGIYAGEGAMTVSYTTLAGNTAQDNPGGGAQGGGVFVENAVVTVSHSTISANQALAAGDGNGGGLYVLGTLVMTNSTVSGNAVDRFGGGIYSADATVKLDHVTVTGNFASKGGVVDGMGGGIFASVGFTPVELKNTILAGNVDESPAGSDVEPDCGEFMGFVVSHGYNLIGDKTDCENVAWKTTDQVGNASGPLEPILNPLADNGGATLTHALQPGSPALDTATCTDIGGGPVTFDQRLVDRPQGSGCDIGGYEAEPVLAITKSATPATNVPYHGAVTYNIALENRGAGDALTVYVADVLPAEVVFARWAPGGKPAGATLTGSDLAWSGPVPSGQTVTFALVVTHTGDYGDQVSNTAHYNHAGGSGSDNAVFSVETATWLPIVLKRTGH